MPLALPLWIPACAGMTGDERNDGWCGHPPLTSLRSFAPPSLCERGVRVSG